VLIAVPAIANAQWKPFQRKTENAGSILKNVQAAALVWGYARQKPSRKRERSFFQKNPLKNTQKGKTGATPHSGSVRVRLFFA
jgi:hypothetical protein